jgi:hypothetical protein
MRLWAAVTPDTFKRVDPNACVWTSTDKRLAGAVIPGLQLLKKGEHRCTLVVQDSGGKSEQSILFTTISSEIEHKPDSTKY